MMKIQSVVQSDSDSDSGSGLDPSVQSSDSFDSFNHCLERFFLLRVKPEKRFTPPGGGNSRTADTSVVHRLQALFRPADGGRTPVLVLVQVLPLVLLVFLVLVLFPALVLVLPLSLCYCSYSCSH